jgi:chromosome partitioning protein
MQQLMRTIDDVRDTLNPDLVIRGILPTKYDSRTGHARDMLGIIQEKFPELMMDCRIDLATAINEANTAAQSILTYDSTSKAAMQYRTFVAELLEPTRVHDRALQKQEAAV